MVLLLGVIHPDLSGVNRSGPSSPTVYSTPAVTGPPYFRRLPESKEKPPSTSSGLLYPNNLPIPVNIPSNVLEEI